MKNPHFAYPNVLPKERVFVGCGRYTALHHGSEIGDEYEEIGATPNTPNKTYLDHAIQLLAPESYDSQRRIFEKKDHPEQPYRGNSLHLAYLLAHIQRANQFKGNISGDIWCTGTIETKDSIPVLKKVDEKGFQLKLVHFLKDDHNDQLFIVPAANIQKESLDIIAAENANTLSMTQLRSGLKTLPPRSKTILKVLPNELPALVKILFKRKHHGLFRKKKTFSLLLLFMLFAAGIWVYWHAPSIEVEAIMHVRKKGTVSDIRYVFGQTAKKQPILSHEDNYKLTVTPKNPDKKYFLYIFQIDETMQIFRLFPKNNRNPKNPVLPDNWPIEIPSGENQWIYLDRLPVDRTKGMDETIFLLLSLAPTEDIQSMYREIINETDLNVRSLLIQNFQEALKKPQNGNDRSVVYRQLTFRHI